MKNNTCGILDADLITVHLRAASKHEALAELAGMLADHNYIESEDRFIRSVLNREKNGSTALGFGLVIPHGESNTVSRSVLAIGISQHDIEWATPDQIPVRIIVLLAINSNRTDDLRIHHIQQVVSRLADEELINLLKKAGTKYDVIQLLTENE
ncbi:MULTISPECIES: PTS sugar transporter subunit IIA [unclassified Sporolactobacillus]|uniref:PTS sugar transporter subunit IIA n=1 Tax=unclassified Sporolactobacillus TaxID=2628533 RepID=UPI002367D9A7|nr:PTS sugar transporter subunit IIA [Sporolactobacillus sp. CQH2019]MDD9148930.1 PTS sugar transporter subunit IIA [Sporolactobacillus sp. CQH2019]